MVCNKHINDKKSYGYHMCTCRVTESNTAPTSREHTARNFEYQTDPKTSVGTGMILIPVSLLVEELYSEECNRPELTHP